MQGLALGIGGWAEPVEFVPETTHTTNGLATFSRGLVASADEGRRRIRASSPRPAFASVDEWNTHAYGLVVERGRRAAYLPRVTSFAQQTNRMLPLEAEKAGIIYRCSANVGTELVDTIKDDYFTTASRSYAPLIFGTFSNT